MPRDGHRPAAGDGPVGLPVWTVLYAAMAVAGLRGLAFAWIAALDTVVVWMPVLIRRERVAFWFMAPYAGWLAFATALDGAVWWLNR